MSKKLRGISQLFFVVLVSLISLNHFLVESGIEIPFIGSSSLHSICPFGGIEAIMALVFSNVMISKIHESSFVLTGIILILGILFGPVVCSYICPLGTIQEWIGKIGKKIFKKKYNHMIPVRLDKILRYLRYFVLIFTVYLTTQSLRLIFLEVDPYFALFNFWSDEVTVGGLVVLAIILVSSLFIERPWCKYACPFGAFIGLTNYISIFKIRRNTTTCISCKKCDDVCPMNITVSDKKVIRDHQCIRCNECTSDVVCPVSETVELKINNYKEEV